jgi:alkylmercury lyase-like protein
MHTDAPLLWQVRAFVYNHFADTALPPGVGETAQHFNIGIEETKILYRDLHNRHAFFLEPDTLNIRMANPFSGVRTDFKVHANGKTYFANCAWDMLGIPIALHSEAVIEAVCTESDDRVQLEVREGKILAAGDGGLRNLLVHFPLPFARWYDDLTFT